MEKKTYILMISEVFPKYHPRAGEPTHFEDKIRSGEKKHTIRKNFEFWAKRTRNINNGYAVLSVRKWTGKPHRSKQKELFRFEKLAVQKIEHESPLLKIGICPYGIDFETISSNDGLSKDDFFSWFKDCPKNVDCVIHFTDFRY
jgi:hypothetical protein